MVDQVSSIPFHLAKAYSIERAEPVPPVRPITARPVAGVAPVAPAAPAKATGASDGLRLFHPQGGTKANPGVAKLVAAQVPGTIDFSADDPQPRTGSLALYHAPAARNAAATGVDLGRMLDTTA